MYSHLKIKQFASALTSFIPFSIPIETKKRKPTSASKTRKTVQNENQNILKTTQIDQRSSIKEKKFVKSDLISPSVRTSKRSSVYKPTKTINKENYDDIFRNSGSKNDRSRSSKSRQFKKGLYTSQSQASLTFGKSFFNRSNPSKYGSLIEISPNLKQGNSNYLQFKVDSVQKKRPKTPTSGINSNRKSAKVNNYMYDNRPSTAKKSVSPTKRSRFPNYFE